MSIARNNGTMRGSSNSSATNGAATNPIAASIRLVPKPSQKAVDRSRSSTLLRCTRALVSPSSVSVPRSCVASVASATRPKSCGASSLARIAVTASPDSRRATCANANHPIPAFTFPEKLGVLRVGLMLGPGTGARDDGHDSIRRSWIIDGIIDHVELRLAQKGSDSLT